MKRTCNGCRALESRRHHYYCSLGYKVEQDYFQTAIAIGAKPKEECPKPTTFDKYLLLRNR